MKYDMVLNELKWDRSFFIWPWSYADPRSNFDQRWCIRSYEYL